MREKEFAAFSEWIKACAADPKLRKPRLWQHSLVLLAAPESDQAAAFAKKAVLPAGKYRIEAYVDKNGDLSRDWKTVLGKNALVGTAEIETKWIPGYGKMTELNAAALK